MTIRYLLFFCFFGFAHSVLAQSTETASYPTEIWRPHGGISYSYFNEDKYHPCNHEETATYDPYPGDCYTSGFSFDNSLVRPGIKRNCLFGVGSQCSVHSRDYVHAGWDFDYPAHTHKQEGYDPNEDSEYHGSSEDSIYPIASGEIAFINAMNNYDYFFGNTVIIRHYCDSYTSIWCVDDPYYGSVIYTQYSHMSEIDQDVLVGVWVDKDFRIGKVGGTGKINKHKWIDHLHLEFKTTNYLANDCDQNGSYESVGYVDKTKYAIAGCGYRDPAHYFAGNVTFYKTKPTGGTGGNGGYPPSPCPNLDYQTCMAAIMLILD